MKNTSLTLIILSPGFPKDESDSTCLPAQQVFVKALNKNFPDLKIIILAFEYPFNQTQYQWHNNTVIPFNGRDKGGINKIFVWLKVWKCLKQLKKENNVAGVLNFWCTECAFVGEYFARFNGLIHYSWILGQDARKMNKYVRWMNPHPEELIAMSDSLAKEFYNNHGIKPAYVITNGIDESLFATARPKRDIDVIGVGSLIPLKRFDVFIDIISELKKQIPSIKAVICGNGPEKNALQSKIDQLQLNDQVLLVGKKPHHETLALMQQSKVLLHTSSYEGFSSACLEALYAGAQVISFCKPMDSWIRNWHVAESNDEMQRMVYEILQDGEINYRPIMPYSMDNSARLMMALFNVK